jgi:hypothetical protein
MYKKYAREEIKWNLKECPAKAREGKKCVGGQTCQKWN